MALARIKTWIAGEVLTASDLNAEYNNILNNPTSLISPLTGAISLNGQTITLDAAGASSFVSSASGSFLLTSGAKAGTPGTTGSVLNMSAQTFTDSNTAGSGTAASHAFVTIQRPTLAATNASVVTTNAAVLYLANDVAAGTNETLSNTWAIWVDAGKVRFDDSIQLGGDSPLLDSSGNEYLKFSKTASAVNEITVTNAATGTGPQLSATGGDTDIDLVLASKGAGFVTASDSVFAIRGSGDATKKVRFEVDGLTTASTRVITPPDVDVTLPYKPGTFGSVQVFTASGTWTKPAGLKRVKVTVVGAGGGSGGCAATGGAQVAAAGGGGAGGVSIKVVEAASLGSTETVTVGTGGLAGTAGNNAGGTGNTSSFGTQCSATGGSGGSGSGATGGTVASANGGAAGSGSTGDVNLTGGAGGTGIAFGPGNSAMSGFGGDGEFGGGGLATGTGVGASGGARGGGASGSALLASSSATAGSAGGGGIVIVEEFF